MYRFAPLHMNRAQREAIHGPNEKVRVESLGQGVQFERRLFHGLFGTEDQAEGMSAFVEKREGQWKGK